MKMAKITARKAWTKSDNIEIVNLYNAMLELQRTGTKYSKAPMVRAVAENQGRSKGSVECKLMNVSAIRQQAGLDIVQGYKALSNYNKELVDVVMACEVKTA